MSASAGVGRGRRGGWFREEYRGREGKREREREAERDREGDRERGEVEVTEPVWVLVVCVCVCGCVRVGSDLALVGGGGRNQELVRCLGCCVLEASSTIGRRGRCTT